MIDPLEKSPPSMREIQMVYFNGFAVGFGNADISIRLKIDNVDIVELKASYTTAKTMAEALRITIDQFESVTDHTLLTAKEIAGKIVEKKRSDKDK
jgi:hypothetical protein